MRTSTTTAPWTPRPVSAPKHDLNSCLRAAFMLRVINILPCLLPDASAVPGVCGVEADGFVLPFRSGARSGDPELCAAERQADAPHVVAPRSGQPPFWRRKHLHQGEGRPAAGVHCAGSIDCRSTNRSLQECLREHTYSGSGLDMSLVLSLWLHLHNWHAAMCDWPFCHPFTFESCRTWTRTSITRRCTTPSRRSATSCRARSRLTPPASPRVTASCTTKTTSLLNRPSRR